MASLGLRMAVIPFNNAAVCGCVPAHPPLAPPLAPSLPPSPPSLATMRCACGRCVFMWLCVLCPVVRGLVRMVQMLNGVRLNKIQPELKVLQQRLQEAQRERRPDLMAAINKERQVP